MGNGKNLADLIQGEPRNPSHKLAKVFVLEGEVNIACLQAAMSALPKHHPVLRSYYKNGVRYQQSLEKSDSTIRHHDLTNMKNKPIADQILNKIKAIISRDIDIANAPLFAFDLIKVSDQKSILISQVSHMLCGGFSAGILFYELSALYNVLLKVDFINEIRRRMNCGELGTQLALPILSQFVPGGAFLPAKSYAKFVKAQQEKTIGEVELSGEDFHQFTPKWRKSFDTNAESASNCGIVTHAFSKDFNKVGPFFAKEKYDSNLSKLLLATLMLTANEINEGSCSIRIPHHNRHN